MEAAAQGGVGPKSNEIKSNDLEIDFNNGIGIIIPIEIWIMIFRLLQPKGMSSRTTVQLDFLNRIRLTCKSWAKVWQAMYSRLDYYKKPKSKMRNAMARLGYLTSLEKLHMFWLEPGDVKIVSDEMNCLKDLNLLKDLCIWTDSLREPRVRSTADYITNFTNLESIVTVGLRFSKENITSLTRLTYLNITAEDFEGYIFELTQLKQLIYKFEHAAPTLPDPGISKLTRLKELNLHGVCANWTIDSVFTLPNLTQLYLNKKGITSVPLQASQLVHLVNLWLDDNRITEIPTHLLVLPYLKSINLRRNLITTIPIDDNDLYTFRLSYPKYSADSHSRLLNLQLKGNPLEDSINNIQNLGETDKRIVLIGTN